MVKPAKPGFYAVKHYLTQSIYFTPTNLLESIEREETKLQTEGFPRAIHKKFTTKGEAEAFLTQSGTPFSSSSSSNQVPTISKRPRDDAAYVDTTSSKKKKEKGKASVPSQEAKGRVVYCDGSSLGNGKNGATAGSGVFWSHGPEGSKLNISERLPGKLQTNNRAEMFAIARVLELDPTPTLPLTICTDSAYSIGAFSTWISNWRRNNWVTSSGTPVMNKDLILYVLSLLALRQAKVAAAAQSEADKTNFLGREGGGITSNIIFQKVKAHVGIEGNEEADRFAKDGAMLAEVEERDFERERKRVEEEAREIRRRTRERQVGSKEAKSGKEVLVIDDEDEGTNEEEAEFEVQGLLTKEELDELERTQDF